MKIAGVISEYNPFHYGHAYHLQKTREQTGCDYIVICMDGSYTQRGTAACLSKWDRARMALRCGADAVFELPALFAVRTADVFALAGVAVLGGLGVDVLSFGSETGDRELLMKLAALRESEPESVTESVRQNLALGMSHARAWGCAASEYLGVDVELLNSPNMILGAEYIRATRILGFSMEVSPVVRVGSYHDGSLTGDGFASATAIRAAMDEGRLTDALDSIPEPARNILQSAGAMHAPDDLLLHRLRTMTESEIAALPDVVEGLERRVKQCVETAATVEELIEAIKCKRYTRARLTRLTAHALLGLTAEFAQSHPAPTYARLIGMRAEARPLLAELKKRAQLPIASDPVKLKNNPIFQLECTATDLRALQCDQKEDRRSSQEFTQKFVREGGERDAGGRFMNISLHRHQIF